VCVGLSRSHNHTLKTQGSIEKGKLKAVVDTAKFVGLEQVPDAVEHMYAGKNIGKVTVRIGD
jgi:NADPH-dependent curcumin reductase CurA